MQDNNLHGIPLYGDGTFDTDDSFQIELWNEMLKEEIIDGQPLPYYWYKALKALKEKV